MPKPSQKKHYPKGLSPAIFVAKLLEWYKKHRRELPWRNTKDPYKIWLSEIILQQTKVAQGLPYYKKIVAAYPTITDLARASEKEILHLWQGLGYYTRARNLHACAQYIAKKLNNTFPNTYTSLLKLPGIGPYTAAAIASIAFKEQVPAVDGNVYRVLARIFGLLYDIASPSGKKLFFAFAKAIIPNHSIDTYNQAIMEFGALYCTPHQPACSKCPFQDFCIAYHTNQVQILPIKKKVIKIKHRFFHYLVIHANNQVYLKKRTEKDIWKGLYDFYLIENIQGLQPFHSLQDNIVHHIKKYNLEVKKSTYTPIHQLTHQRLHCCFFHIYTNQTFIKEATPLLQKIALLPYKKLDKLPMSILIKHFCEKDLNRFWQK